MVTCMFVESVFESDISFVKLDTSLSLSVPGTVLLNLAIIYALKKHQTYCNSSYWTCTSRITSASTS